MHRSLRCAPRSALWLPSRTSVGPPRTLYVATPPLRTFAAAPLRSSHPEVLHSSPRAALELVRHNKKLSRNIFAHNQVLHRLITSGERELAMKHLADLEQSGLKLLASTYTPLLTEAARKGDVREAEALYSRMEAQGLKSDPVSTSVMIMAHARAGNVDAAQQLLFTAPNVTEAAYGSIVQVLVRDGKLAEAGAVLERMRSKGVRSSVAHTLLARVLLKADDLQAFRALLSAAHANRDSFSEDVYNTLLIESAAKRLSITVEDALEMMRKEGLNIGRPELRAAMDGHLQVGDLKGAEARLNDMCAVLKTDAPSAEIFADGVAVLRLRRHFEGVLQWAEIIEKRKVPISGLKAAACLTIAEAARRLGKSEVEQRWMARAKEAGLTTQPKVAHAQSSALMHRLEKEAKNGPLLKGLAMLRSSRDRGQMPSIREWEFVVENLLKHKYSDLASNVLRVMRESGISPSSALVERVTTARVLSEVEIGHVRNAESILRDSSSECPPSEEAVLALVRLHALNNNPAQAFAVFRLLPTPDTNSYVSVSQILSQHGGAAQAETLWQEFDYTGLPHSKESSELAEKFKYERALRSQKRWEPASLAAFRAQKLSGKTTSSRTQPTPQTPPTSPPQPSPPPPPSSSSPPASSSPPQQDSSRE